MPASPSVCLQHPEFHGRIGVARREITPPIDIYARMWGSATHDMAAGVHRPLLGSCLVFEDFADPANQLILVALDVMILWHEEALKIREAILTRLKLAPHQLILHPSHSHGTPILARRHADRPGGQHIGPYLDSLPGVCCELIEQARASAVSAMLSWTYGKCGLAFNRDFIDPSSGRDVCGLNDAVAADDTVLVGRVTDDSGTIRATLVNYACHPVSLGGGNKLLSPDFIGAMRETVERDAGGVCVFLHGASGDMTPRRSYEVDVQAADQNGRELGYAALSALVSMFPPGQELRYEGIEESGTALGVWRLAEKQAVSKRLAAEIVTTQLAIKDMPSRAELQQAIALCTDRVELERLERALARRELVGDGVDGDFYFTVWRLGDAFMVSTPAEPYSEFQVELRAKFPKTAIAVLNASDGCLNYLPSPAAYQRDVYQVRAALYAAGSLEAVQSLAQEVIRRMR